MSASKIKSYTLLEAAAISGVVESTVRRWCNRNLLPSYRVGLGRQIRIVPSDLQKFLAASAL